MAELWQEEATRMGGAAFAQVMTEMVAGQRALIIEVAALKARDAAAEEAIAKVLGGFPAGDTEGHRRYHESEIEWRQLRNKMMREALIHVAKVGSLAGLVWIAYAAWNALKISVKQ